MATERVFHNTPLESNIIGTRKSLRGITGNTIREYIDTWYKKDNIVVSVIGNFDEKKLIESLNNNLGDFGSKSPSKEDYLPQEGRRFSNISKDINQTHIALAIPGISLLSDDYYALAIVSEMLGGSMSSRLFQNIREQKGLAYTVYSVPVCYSKTGMFYIYAGVSLGKEALAVEAIAEELDALKKEGISKEDIENVKMRLKSGYIFSQESLSSRMNIMGKNRLLLGRNYTQEETLREIDAVSEDRTRAMIDMICDIKKYSGVTISKNRLDLKKLIG